MINSDSLREILKDIYGVQDKYLVPLDTDTLVPTAYKDDTIGTWIGYRILRKRRYVRADQDNGAMCVELRLVFRLVFIGPEAEKLANQTLLWDNRADVVKAFGKYEAQLNYTTRQLHSFSVNNSGFNTAIGWAVDIPCQTVYYEDMNKGSWFNT